jgi:hypothetical protein
MKREKSRTESEVLAKLRKAQAMNDDVGIKLDELQYILAEGGVLDGIARCRAPQQLQQARKLQVMFGADGSASVAVDDLMPFSVPPVLAKLAQILAVGKGNTQVDCPEDPFVPFKSFDEIISIMAKSLDRDFSESALKQSIHRLRKILSFHGFGGLLQTNRQKRAYRLAVRRQKDSIIADSD